MFLVLGLTYNTLCYRNSISFKDQILYADNKRLNTELLPCVKCLHVFTEVLPCGQTFYSHKSRVKKFLLEYQPEGDPEDWQSFYLHTGKYNWSMQVSTYCEHRQKLSAVKFRKNSVPHFP